MTGKFTPQPFVDDDVVCLYNGEIYNHDDFGDFDSDGKCLIPTYREHGVDFIKKLEGEFAIILVDFSKDILVYSTDIFSIKPLFVGRSERDIAISSYQSCLDGLGFSRDQCFQVPANQTTILRLSDLTELDTMTVYDFDLTQKKNSFDDWIKAFEKSIWKRTRDAKHGIFMGLSSGYDSGCIAAELTRQNVKFTAYSIVGHEDEEIIKKRCQQLSDYQLMYPSREDFLKARNHLKSCCEEYHFKIDNGEKENYLRNLKNYEEQRRKYEEAPSSRRKALLETLENRLDRIMEQIDYRDRGQLVTDDNGSIGVSHICSSAKKQKSIIYLSGSGADEVFSDYGFNGVKHFGHSTIGGKFPEDLSTVFPWKNFFGNTQRAYLMKEEMVTASYGIEGRYPFLDKWVVQEFLWLKPELKNSNYKSTLHEYMSRHSYPFAPRQKVGFNCGFSNVKGSYETKNKTSEPIPVGDNPRLKVDLNEVVSLKKMQKERCINFDSMISQIRNPYHILVTSTQYPGNGGGATNSYKLIKHLRTLNIKATGIFFLCNNEDPDKIKVDPDNIGGVYFLKSFWKDGAITSSLDRVNEVKRNIVQFMGSQPNLILAKNILAPISSYRLYPTVPLVYVVSGVSSLTLLNNSLEKPVTAQQYLSNPQPYREMLKPGFPGYQNMKVEYITMDISDWILPNSELTATLLQSFFPEHSEQIHRPINTSLAIDISLPVEPIDFNKRKFDVAFISSSMRRKIKNPSMVKQLFADPRLAGMNKLLIGKGELFCEEELAQIKNLTVKPLLPTNRLFKFMNRTRLVIIPSLFDSSPNTMYEALQAGCNCLISKNIGNYESFPEEMVCDDVNIDEWVDKIRFLVTKKIEIEPFTQERELYNSLNHLRRPKKISKNSFDKDISIVLASKNASSVGVLELEMVSSHLADHGYNVSTVLFDKPHFQIRPDHIISSLSCPTETEYLYMLSRLRKQITDDIGGSPDFVLGMQKQSTEYLVRLFPELESYQLLIEEMDEVSDKCQLLPVSQSSSKRYVDHPNIITQVVNPHGEMLPYPVQAAKDYQFCCVIDRYLPEYYEIIKEVFTGKAFKHRPKLLLLTKPSLSKHYSEIEHRVVSTDELQQIIGSSLMLVLPDPNFSESLLVSAYLSKTLPLIPTDGHYSERFSEFLQTSSLEIKIWIRKMTAIINHYNDWIDRFSLFQRKTTTLSDWFQAQHR